MVIEPTAMDKPKTLWHRVQPCIVSFFVIKSMTNSKQAGAGAVLPRAELPCPHGQADRRWQVRVGAGGEGSHREGASVARAARTRDGGGWRRQ